MRELANHLPSSNGPHVLSDETKQDNCCALHEITSKNMENNKVLANTGEIEKVVNITKSRGDRSLLKAVKKAAQVLNTLWHQDLQSISKKNGCNQNYFVIPLFHVRVRPIQFASFFVYHWLTKVTHQQHFLLTSLVKNQKPLFWTREDPATYVVL